MVGASGGIAGVLGAYILLHPKAAVRVFMLILIFIRVISLPAWVVLGVWIAGQFVSAPSSAVRRWRSSLFCSHRRLSNRYGSDPIFQTQGRALI